MENNRHWLDTLRHKKNLAKEASINDKYFLNIYLKFYIVGNE
jgi:hypothetical protein